MEQIKITGDNLSEEEKQIADKILNENYKKIQRQLKNEIILILHVKEYNSDGQRKKYSLILEVKSSTNSFKAEAVDWDFARTLHKTINKAITEIEHKFHVSEQR